MSNRVRSQLVQKTLYAIPMLIVLGIACIWTVTLAVLAVVLWLIFVYEIGELVLAYRLTRRLVLEYTIVSLGMISMVMVRHGSLRWMLAVGVCIIVSDSMANIVGRAIGKRFIRVEFSSYSPNKSWEGTIAGVASGVAAFVAVLATGREHRFWILVAVGTLIAVAGVWGDLQQSRMKRELSPTLKDTSNHLGAHGGMSERLDSLSRGYLAGGILMFIVVLL